MISEEKIYEKGTTKLAKMNYTYEAFNEGQFTFSTPIYATNAKVLNLTTSVYQMNMKYSGSSDSKDDYGLLRAYDENIYTDAMSTDSLQENIVIGISYDNRNRKTGYIEEKTIWGDAPSSTDQSPNLAPSQYIRKFITTLDGTQREVVALSQPITTVRDASSVKFNLLGQMTDYKDTENNTAAPDMTNVITMSNIKYNMSGLTDTYDKLERQYNNKNNNLFNVYQFTQRTYSNYDATSRLYSYADTSKADPNHHYLNAKPNVITDTVVIMYYDTKGRARKQSIGTMFYNDRAYTTTALYQANNTVRYNLSYNDAGLVKEYVDVTTGDVTRPDVKVWKKVGGSNYNGNIRDGITYDNNGRICTYTEKLVEYSADVSDSLWNGGDYNMDGIVVHQNNSINSNYTRRLRAITTTDRHFTNYDSGTGQLYNYYETAAKSGKNTNRVYNANGTITETTVNYADAITTNVERGNMRYDSVGRVYSFTEYKHETGPMALGSPNPWLTGEVGSPGNYNHISTMSRQSTEYNNFGFVLYSVDHVTYDTAKLNWFKFQGDKIWGSGWRNFTEYEEWVYTSYSRNKDYYRTNTITSSDRNDYTGYNGNGMVYNTKTFNKERGKSYTKGQTASQAADKYIYSDNQRTSIYYNWGLGQMQGYSE
ncbi:MAG: hypothetical protein COW10_00125, partial [Candidatus Omnitrophica bacterium CG12_big_fil_rev_8_21_14_0_65_42_8]